MEMIKSKKQLVIFACHIVNDESIRRAQILYEASNQMHYQFCWVFANSEDSSKIPSYMDKIVDFKITYKSNVDYPTDIIISVLDYISTLKQDIEYFWLIEYDVMFLGDWKLLFQNFDDKDYDLVTKKPKLQTLDSKWHWLQFVDKNELSANCIYGALNCVFRISQTGIQSVRKYIASHKSNYMYEIIVPTACILDNLKVADLNNFLSSEFLQNNIFKCRQLNMLYYTIKLDKKVPNFKREYFFKLCMPSHNVQRTFRKTLDSIMNQSFKDFALIICDDNSTDGTFDIAKEYYNKYENVYLTTSDGGNVSKARNTAFDYPVKSKFTWFIDSDDQLNCNNALLKIYNKIVESDCDAIFINVIMNVNSHEQYLLFHNDALSQTSLNAPYLKVVKSNLMPHWDEDLVAAYNDMPHHLECINILADKKIVYANECLYYLNGIHTNYAVSIDYLKMLIKKIENIKTSNNEVQNSIDVRVNRLKKQLQLKETNEQSKINNAKTILTYGTYDILHYGHVNFLKRAKDLAGPNGKLIVGLSTDNFHQNLKHKPKCYFSYEQRKTVLESIGLIDQIIPEETWEQKKFDIEKYDVDILVMGDDWSGAFDSFENEKCKVMTLPRTVQGQEPISDTLLKNDAYNKIAASHDKLDLIFPFVDNHDPEWQKQFEYWSKIETDNGILKRTHQTDTRRYREWGHLKYLFRGFEKNIPWIDRIFIVLSSKTQIPFWLNVNNPKLRIIYHEDYMPKEVLPSFNALSIESFYSFIPDLGEYYIASNDDWFFLNPIPKDFFIKDGVLQLSYDSRPTYWDLNNQYTTDPWSKMINNVFKMEMYMHNHFGRLHLNFSHLPEIRCKKLEQEWFTSDDNLNKTIKMFSKSKFRHIDNAVLNWFFIHLLKFNCDRVPFKNRTYKFRDYKCAYCSCEAKQNFNKYSNCGIVCFNDSAMTPINDNEFDNVKNKLIEFLHSKFPEKSEFETVDVC